MSSPKKFKRCEATSPHQQKKGREISRPFFVVLNARNRVEGAVFFRAQRLQKCPDVDGTNVEVVVQPLVTKRRVNRDGFCESL